MKVKVILQQELEEICVDIRTPKLSDEALQIEQCVSNCTTMTKVLGTQDTKSALLPLKQIVRFYTHKKKVYAQTSQGNWLVKYTMAHLEELLPSADFVRINQGEIINLSYVTQFDHSLKNTIGAQLSTGQTSFVSRRYLKRVKQALTL